MLDVLAPVAVSMLLFVGFVKDNPLFSRAPTDLTLLAAALVAGLILVELFRYGLVIPRGIGVVLVLWSTFLVGLLGAGGTSYSSDKIIRLYSLTLLAALGAVVLLGTRRRRTIWLWSVVVVGLLVLTLALVSPDQVLLEAGRLGSEGSNSIATARAAGAAAVVLAVGSALRVVPRVPGFLLAMVVTGLMVATGSRGPLLAGLLAIGLVVVVRPGTLQKRATRVVLSLALAAVTAVVVYLTAGRGAGFSRIVALATGDEDTSSRARVDLATRSFDLIASHPFGIGWGNLALYLPGDGFSGDRAQLRYPHNIFLEVTLEAGWFTGAALVVFLVVGLVLLARRSGDPVEAVVLAVAAFFVVNALVSGDVNDNRMMFAPVALAWATGGRPIVLTDRRRRRAAPRPSNVGRDEPSHLHPETDEADVALTTHRAPTPRTGARRARRERAAVGMR